MKRFLSIILAICIAAGLLCAGMVPVSAEGADISGDFTDANFKAAVYAEMGKQPGDSITAEECADVHYLSVDGLGIQSLAGLAHFVNLWSLTCEENQLKTLDVSGSPNLEVLWCGSNQLTALDLTQNPQLISLACDYNQLSVLDISRNPDLVILYCGANQLSALDVSGSLNLETLWCGSNQLTALDVTQNPQLRSLACDYNQLSVLDVSGSPNLETLWCGSNQIAMLDVTQNQQLISLTCDNNQLSVLNVSGSPNLNELWCNFNQLATLDVTKNPNLEVLVCDNNRLTSLDLTNNTGIKELYVGWNHFSSKEDVPGLDALALENEFEFYPQYGIQAPPWPKWKGNWFATADEAARDFALTYMAFQLAENVEFGAVIYRKFNWKTFKLGYGYAKPRRGEEYQVRILPPFWMWLCPFLFVGTMHTHPFGNDFSDGGDIGDISNANSLYKTILVPCFQYAYVSSPNGEVRRYTPKTKTNEVIYTDLDYFAKYA